MSSKPKSLLLFLATAMLLAATTNNVEAKDSALTNTATPIPAGFITTTTDSLDGRHIKQYLGIVRGVTVRQPTIGQSMKAGLKGIVGGRMSPFISMCETARQAAYEIVVQQAVAMGANAVVGLRYDSSAFGESDEMGTEVVCYGTAVIVESGADDAPSKHASLPVVKDHM
ncbi:MAG: YbjQ family protein [Candidatus Obscuribacterales bacterium]|nr:YbjQ family protein [Candidatus Obscuribacterales bacterium]